MVTRSWSKNVPVGASSGTVIVMVSGVVSPGCKAALYVNVA